MSTANTSASRIGTPIINVDNVGAGTFDIVLINAHAINNLNGVLQISFAVL